MTSGNSNFRCADNFPPWVCEHEELLSKCTENVEKARNRSIDRISKNLELRILIISKISPSISRNYRL